MRYKTGNELKDIFSKMMKQRIINISYSESVERLNGYWRLILANGTVWDFENLKQVKERIKN